MSFLDWFFGFKYLKMALPPAVKVVWDIGTVIIMQALQSAPLSATSISTISFAKLKQLAPSPSIYVECCSSAISSDLDFGSLANTTLLLLFSPSLWSLPKYHWRHHRYFCCRYVSRPWIRREFSRERSRNEIKMKLVFLPGSGDGKVTTNTVKCCLLQCWWPPFSPSSS